MLVLYCSRFQIEYWKRIDFAHAKMAKEDMLLPVQMGKLEIEPTKSTKNVNVENPFTYNLQEKHNTRASLQVSKCSCSLQRRNNKTGSVCKKRRIKILKDPVLRLLQTHDNNKNVISLSEFEQSNKSMLQCQSSQDVATDNFSLCALVDNCNQMKISSGSNESGLIVAGLSNDNKWWKKDVTFTKSSEKSRPGPSCSQQALNPPCDVTIDELASYFETLVHIPKKMSSMAEMMYI